MTYEIKTLPLSAIRTNGGTQTRVQLNAAAVKEYGEAMTEGVHFPPVTVFFDGADHWLADGFHRVQASMDIGALSIDAEIRPGNQRDAKLYSVGANAHHGLRRTNEDKRKAVHTLLADTEWAAWSDREIAKACVVSRSLVAEVRSSLAEKPVTTGLGEKPAGRTYKTKHGTTAQMDTEGVAESNKARAKEARPTEAEVASPAAIATPLEKHDEEPGPVVVEKAPTAAALAKAAKQESKAVEENVALKARIADLEEELEGYRGNCADLADEVKALSAAVDPNHARKFLEQSGYVRTLESQRDDWMNKATMLAREVKSLRKKLEKSADSSHA